MSDTSQPDPAQAVQAQQQRDAEALFQRLAELEVKDLTVHYTLERSAVTLPAVLVRLVTLAVLFRLNSAKKWGAVLGQQILPEPLRKWLDIDDLAQLADRATVDWIPAGVLLDTLSWQVAQCLTECLLPQPMAVIRQTIGELLLRDAARSEGGLVLNRKFWRHVAEKGARSLSAELLAECRQRIEFVLGQVGPFRGGRGRGRWLDVPELERTRSHKLEAVRVASHARDCRPCRRHSTEGCFDFVANLLACSYSRCGRRAHHPLLLVEDLAGHVGQWTIPKPGAFLGDVDDSIQLRLFLQVIAHEQLPSERRIKGFATERMAPVIEYLVLWHQFLLLRDGRIEIGTEFGTDGADMHALARMKTDAAARFIALLLGWLIEECRRFCERTGRTNLSPKRTREFLWKHSSSWIGARFGQPGTQSPEPAARSHS